MSNVVPFHRKRGRPKTIRNETDFGTPELQFKRAHGETAEALDLCLEKGIITPEQHWCGIHLRWLYTLRYGAPGVRALDPNHISGSDIENDDPNWRSAREAEYNEAIGKIAARGYAMLLLNICIYNDRPLFLQNPKNHLRANIISVERLRDGLDILAKHWRKSGQRPPKI